MFQMKMESEFSPLLFSGSSMPDDQSLYFNDMLSGYRKPSEQQSLFQNSAPMQDPSLQNDRLFGDCDDISAMLDNNDIFQSLWDDFPLETPAEKNIAPTTQSVQFSLPTVSSVCKTEPTLAQLNAPIPMFEPTLTQVNTPRNAQPITLDEIESIIFDDLQGVDIKPAVSPSAVVPESVEMMRAQSPSKPVVTSPYLQQLLSGGVEGVNVHTESSTMPDTVTYSLPAQQVSPVAERQSMASPPRSRIVMTTPPIRMASRPLYSMAQNQLRRPMKKQNKFSRTSRIDKPYIGRYSNSSSVRSDERVGRPSSSSSSQSQGQGQGDGAYFWQYNTQAKGPKGQRLCRSLTPDDPHKLMSFEDPVFDPDLSRWNLRHTGKARRGDGNDISPNPYRLHQIGKELNKLNNLLDGIAPEDARGGELRRAKRAKNKFASRACRLKRKAQHEANKLKLFGLQREHGQLLSVLSAVKDTLRHYLRTGTCDDDSLTSTFGQLSKQMLTVTVAGRTSEYVSGVLDRVAAGDRNGGIYSR